jgi:hypothetical protein
MPVPTLVKGSAAIVGAILIRAVAFKDAGCDELSRVWEIIVLERYKDAPPLRPNRLRFF